MLYPLEELELDFGGTIVYRVSCSIEVTESEHHPSDSGVPYGGGQNLPEPSTPEHYTVLDWEVNGSIHVLVSEPTELELEFSDHDSPEFKYLVRKIRECANWEHINEKLTEHYIW